MNFSIEFAMVLFEITRYENCITATRNRLDISPAKVPPATAKIRRKLGHPTQGYGTRKAYIKQSAY